MTAMMLGFLVEQGSGPSAATRMLRKELEYDRQTTGVLCPIELSIAV